MFREYQNTKSNINKNIDISKFDMLNLQFFIYDVKIYFVDKYLSFKKCISKSQKLDDQSLNVVDNEYENGKIGNLVEKIDECLDKNFNLRSILKINDHEIMI